MVVSKKKRRSVAMPKIGRPSRKVPRYCVVIYARTGMGKTTLLGTMSGYGLVIDTSQYEGGTEVLYDDRDHVDVVSVTKWEEFNKLYLALRRGELERDYDWVAIDTVSGATKICWRKVLKERDEIVSQKYHRTPANYGSVGSLMGILFAEFRSLPMPVIFVAQEAAREDEEDEDEMIIGPDLTPMSLKELAPHPKLFGRLFVHRLDSGRWERRLRVGVHAGFYSKSRTIKGRRLPDIIRRPDLANILDWMQGEDVEKPRGAKDVVPETSSGEMELDK